MTPDMRLRSTAIIVLLFAIFSLTDYAQNMSGMPDYGSYGGGSKIDAVNLLDGSVNIEIPLINHQYRGFHYQFGVRYSSDMWKVRPGIESCFVSGEVQAQECTVYGWIPD